jgi:hypothetical protein
VRVRAPAGHAVHLVNCNGAIGWGLAAPDAVEQAPVWMAATDACLSAPITVAPGEQRTLQLAIPPLDPSAPAAGTYRVVLFNAFREWHAPRPFDGPEIARERMASAPVPWVP